MKFTDKIPLQGIFKMRVMRNGILIEDYQDNNLIVDVARTAMAALVSGEGAVKVINRIGFGTDGNGPNPSDIALNTAYTKLISGHIYPGVGQVQFNWSLTTAEANGIAIREFGLICTDGSLFARKTRGVVTKEGDMSIDGSWTLIF